MCTKFYVSCSNTIDVKTENNAMEINKIFSNLKNKSYINSFRKCI